MAKKKDVSTPVSLVIRDFSAAQQANQQFHDDCERRYKAYRGFMERRSEAAQWTSKLHPPYVNQIIEAIVAGMVDRVKFKVRPRPKYATPEEAQSAIVAAQLLERVLTYELDLDKFDEKYPIFVKQGLITGLTVGKTYWNQKKATKYKMEKTYTPVPNEFGDVVGHYEDYQDVGNEELVIDDPCFIPVDVRDFFWPESATSVEDADYLIHRTFVTMDQARKMQQLGVWKNVDDLTETSDMNSTSDREYILFSTNRTKDRIEILEHWTEERVIVVGNRNVELRDYPNPFWHNEKPFVIASAVPDLFQLPGMSVVELCADLQEMLWTLQNQRIDSLRLLANAVTLIRSDVEDADELERFPGAQWVVESPDQVKQLEIDPAAAQITLEAEALLKGDMQNVSGGGPFMSGAASQTIDQKTATGVSIVSTLAQRMVESRKQNYQNAIKRIGIQFVEMMQQFMREDRIISVVGTGGDMRFIRVSPEQIQGRFDVSIEVSNESMMRQERRAEAQAKLQVAAQAAPMFASTGTPLNLKAFMDDYLDAFDVADKQRYYLPGQQQPMGQPQGQPGMSGVQNAQQVMQSQGPNMGVTAPQATAPTSPSNQVSLSPEVFMQRAGTMNGGQGGYG